MSTQTTTQVSIADAVRVDGLVKSFGDVHAVRGVSFTVAPQSIVCLVGPNGAGKTSTVECIEGLQRPDSGTVQVLGMDPSRHRRQLYQRVGVQMQEGGVYNRIRTIEALQLFASMSPKPRSVDDLLEEFGLSDRRAQYYATLSGGEKRRLLIALALIGQPELVILDEPTSGLDPQARYQVWQSLERFRQNGGTVLMTTHQLVEAEQHATDVVVIDHGEVILDGAPRQLLDTEQLITRVAIDQPESQHRSKVKDLSSYVASEDLDSRLVVYGKGPGIVAELSDVVGDVTGRGDVEIRAANLEDLFLLKTGRAYRSGDHA